MSLSTPSVNLRAIQGKGHVPFQERGIAVGKRLEVFRETVGIPLYEPRKGWLPVGKRVHPGSERGAAAGVCLFLIHLKSAGVGESRS